MRVVLSVMPKRFLTISPYAYKVCIFVLSLIVILRKCAQNKHHISGTSYNLVLSTLQVEATKARPWLCSINKTCKSSSVELQLLKHLKGWFLPCHCRLYTALLHTLSCSCLVIVSLGGF